MVLKTLVVALGVIFWLPTAARSAEETGSSDSATPAKCLEAAVNPVTGDAICVNPRGAPGRATAKGRFSALQAARA